MASGDLLLELTKKDQLEKLAELTTIGDIKVTISPHRSLNTSRGVISEEDFLNLSDEELLEGFQEQNNISAASSDGETKLLLDYYAKYAPNVGPMKKFKCKRAMFDTSRAGGKWQVDCDGTTPKGRPERARNQRPSTDRMKHMKTFFDEMYKINEQREARKEERESVKKHVHSDIEKSSKHMKITWRHCGRSPRKGE
ncbi:uncharacterized protein [Dermacentor andersoni]|uniref:uncharacterized protein n=1 Tax=Dermacentor andersoni TaxID=34620 RepID=UPI003B3ADCEC